MRAMQKPKRTTEKRRFISYSQFLANYPCLVIGVVLVVMAGCGTLVVLVADRPDFSNPKKGFDARGTDIRSRTLALHNLKWDSTLISLPPKVNAAVGLAESNLTTPIQRDEGDLLDDWPQSWDPSKYFKLIIESSSVSAKNLYTLEGLHSICSVDDFLPVTSGYSSFSLGVAVALLTNTSCPGITRNDLEAALDIFKTWVLMAQSSCVNGTTDMSSACLFGNEVAPVLDTLTDVGFIDRSTNYTELTYALMLVNIPIEEKVKFYMDHLDKQNVHTGVIRVAGIDSSIKYSIFNKYLIWDTVYFGLAAAIIVVIMCFYLQSIIVTIATVFNVFFSVLLAFTLYSVAFQIRHFSFVNMPTILVLVAIGADDVFIFMTTWELVKRLHSNKDIQFWLSQTMNHAALSIFVTSLTTAFSFLTNLVSDITSIKCFAVFSCLAILCNFVIMLTWIPAVVVLTEKYIQMDKVYKPICFDSIAKITEYGRRFSYLLFSKALPYLITKLWPLWIILFGTLSIWGFIAVLVSPRLRLPNTASTATFTPNHPLEQYDLLQNQFPFAIDQQASRPGMVVNFIWGVVAADNGNHMDPDDFGHLVLDKSFDLRSKEAWNWIKELCLSMRRESFTSVHVHNSSCILELFDNFRDAQCNRTENSCCSSQTNNQSETVSQKCIFDFMESIENISRNTIIDRLYFDLNYEIVAYRLLIPLTQSWSTSFSVMYELYKQLESYLNTKLSGAPNGARSAWFIGRPFSFYDVQRALSAGLYTAILVSTSCAAVVMLFTSLNLYITILAMITIIFTIFFTMGVLVLLGWELNILESTIITLSVGLSIDFSIHYGVAYLLADATDRQERVCQSISRVGNPVTMASLTTFCAGAAILPSEIVVYHQLAIFLMVVMVASWMFATFMFLSMCTLIGPNGDAGNIFSCLKKHDVVDEKTDSTTITQISRSVSQDNRTRFSLQFRPQLATVTE